MLIRWYGGHCCSSHKALRKEISPALRGFTIIDRSILSDSLFQIFDQVFYIFNTHTQSYQ